jgi:pyruvate dehydrogenase E2 component (dihydrolipoamide acetyltransferase)
MTSEPDKPAEGDAPPVEQPPAPAPIPAPEPAPEPAPIPAPPAEVPGGPSPKAEPDDQADKPDDGAYATIGGKMGAAETGSDTLNKPKRQAPKEPPQGN